MPTPYAQPPVALPYAQQGSVYEHDPEPEYGEVEDVNPAQYTESSRTSNAPGQTTYEDVTPTPAPGKTTAAGKTAVAIYDYQAGKYM